MCSCCEDTTQPWFHRHSNQIMQDDTEAYIPSSYVPCIIIIELQVSG